MKIHEYQAKELFRQANIPVPMGYPATTVEDAVAAASKLTTPKVVVKAQIHAGGRGKGGGVKVVDNTPEAVRTAATAILGMQLITHQTGPEGQKVKSLLIEEGSAIAKELYLSFILDRANSQVLVMASPDGGMDIEEVAEKTPERLLKRHIHPAVGMPAYLVREITQFLGIPKEGAKEAAQLITNLYTLYVEKDCSLVEINPLVVTTDNRVLALDGKVTFDSNALYRHPAIVELRDTDEEDPLEVEASKFNLNYIKLDGNVACMVNGAGLAMATMDIIKLVGENTGAAPANFLDVGGSASQDGIENAFRIIMSDPSVEVVLINIFGGILRCDKLANGVVAAAKNLDMKLPMVIRMKGTNVEQGKEILANSDIQFAVAETMKEAAEKVVQFLKQPVGV
ncbi:MAG: ADP-forming succinate--CoA ligase subunit beta [Vampirovibrionales bacterium]